MRSLIASGWIGKLREVHVHGLNDQLADRETPLGWRQMTRYSGFNMLSLGILYETVLRWVAPANRVLAYASKIIPQRFDPEQGKKARVGTPDSVQVLTTQEDGSCGVYRLSSVVWQDNSMAIALYGSEGTLIYDLLHDEIRGAQRGDEGLRVAADTRFVARRLEGRGRFPGRDPGRTPGDPHPLPHRSPLHAIHRGRRPQLAPPGARNTPAPRVFQPQPYESADISPILKGITGIRRM